MLFIGIIYTFSGIKWKYPSPSYFEQSFYILLIVSIFFGKKLFSGRKSIALTFMVLLLFLMTFLSNANSVISRFNPVNENNFSSEDIYKYEIFSEFTSARFKGDESLFYGSVSSMIGLPGSRIAEKIGYFDSSPVAKWYVTDVPELIKEEIDSDLFLANFWRNGLATLEDTNHLVSPYKYIFFSRLLSDTDDFQSKNHLVPTKYNRELFRLLGVRNIVTDQNLNEELLKNYNTHLGKLNLYEIEDTNLGNFSPTEIIYFKDAKEFLNLVQKGLNFDNQALIHENEMLNFSDTEIVKTNSSSLYIINESSYRVVAESKGKSILILPIEFRHSLKFTGEGIYDAFRVNMLLTGILFEGNINIQISAGNLLDNIKFLGMEIDDIKSFNFDELDEIQYPDYLQPLSLFNKS